MHVSIIEENNGHNTQLYAMVHFKFNTLGCSLVVLYMVPITATI